MKRTARTLLCAVLALALTLALLPAAALSEPASVPCDSESGALNVGYEQFSGVFSPFYAATAGDEDVVKLTQVNLLSHDRCGMPILNGIGGETVTYCGTDYAYYGPADLTVTENADGTACYDFTLREGITFSDGAAMTVDDVIFSMYVLADPAYDGPSTFYTLPILGMREYRDSMAVLFDALLAAGRDNTDFTYWDEATQTAFWASVDAAGPAWVIAVAAEIYADYGENNPDLFPNGGTPAECWQLLGYYSLPDDASPEEIWEYVIESYGWDIRAASSIESLYTTFFDCMEDYDLYAVGVPIADVSRIEGIQRIDDHHLRVVLTEISPFDLYSFEIPVAPMHYYGETEKYDYGADMFGFDKGDLRHVQSVSSAPLGAGPYKFAGYDGGTVSFERNDGYYLGRPATEAINFLALGSYFDAVGELLNGTVDIASSYFSYADIDAIENANSNGELIGDAITARTYSALGYGYIGLNAIRMSVGGDPGSEASRALRKAFATVFSVYREAAISDYYGERAGVADYPISFTSWAAPHPGDGDYETAFSRDVNGEAIYAPGMTDAQRQAAALDAALGFFEAAGYTVENGTVTAAPDGAKLRYEIWIPGSGQGDHPAYGIAVEASEALAEIGIDLVVNDLENSAELWSGLDDIALDMWAAAWSAGADPDLYSIYFSDAGNGPSDGEGNPLGGPAQGGSNYMYCITDPELDELIIEGRSTIDPGARKPIYRECLDIIADWAVNVTTYHRLNAFLISTERVDTSTVTPDATVYYGWIEEIGSIRLAGAEPPSSGDIDDSGTVTVADAIICLRAAMHLLDLTPEQIEAGDMSGDGVLTVPDAILILRTAMGLLSIGAR